MLFDFNRMSQVKVPGQEDGSTREQMSTPKKKHMIPLNLKQFLFKPTTLLSIFYTHPKIERVTMKHAIFMLCSSRLRAIIWGQRESDPAISGSL